MTVASVKVNNPHLKRATMGARPLLPPLLKTTHDDYPRDMLYRIKKSQALSFKLFNMQSRIMRFAIIVMIPLYLKYCKGGQNLSLGQCSRRQELFYCIYSILVESMIWRDRNLKFGPNYNLEVNNFFLQIFHLQIII